MSIKVISPEVMKLISGASTLTSGVACAAGIALLTETGGLAGVYTAVGTAAVCTDFVSSISF